MKHQGCRPDTLNMYKVANFFKLQGKPKCGALGVELALHTTTVVNRTTTQTCFSMSSSNQQVRRKTTWMFWYHYHGRFITIHFTIQETRNTKKEEQVKTKEQRLIIDSKTKALLHIPEEAIKYLKIQIYKIRAIFF